MINYEIRDHCIYQLFDDKPPAYCCEEVAVKKVVTDLLSSRKTDEIVVWAQTGPASQCIPREEINRCIIPKLVALGLTLPDTPNNAEVIQNILFDSEADAEQCFEHDRLGFCRMDGKLVFLADTPIGVDDAAKAASHYAQPAVTKPVGVDSDWLDLINREVIGHPCMELALAIGLSAPVAYLLREAKIIAEVPVWALIGSSSTGKTTAMRLMASAFGSPEEGSGLIKDVNTTENAFFATLSNHTGIPLIIDETTGKTGWDFRSVVYNLSKGVNKGRCAASGELCKRLTFSGAIIFSGEESLLDDRGLLGINARLIELTLPWTDDAEHARRLSTAVRTCYGHAVQPYLRLLLMLYEKKLDGLKQLFSKELEVLKEKAEKTSAVDERRFNMLATVMLTLHIARKALGIQPDLKAVRSLLLEQQKTDSDACSMAERLYDSILCSVTSNGAKFPTAKDRHENQLFPQNICGEYATRGYSNCLWIIENTFAEYARSAHVGNYRTYLAEMAEKGFLVKFSGDRYLTRHKIGKVMTKCYCLLLLHDVSKKIETPKRNMKRK